MVTPEQVVVSLAPGISISNITERLGGNVRVVRAMPNTPAMLGEGMTGVSYGEASYTEEEKETIRDIFSSCGRVELVEERLMDAVDRLLCTCSLRRWLTAGSNTAFPERQPMPWRPKLCLEARK